MDDSVFQIPYSPVGALGSITLIVAFLVNAYALGAGIAGQRNHRARWVASARYATYAFTLLMGLASCLIIYAFLSHDFSIRYVAHYSDLNMPFFYTITAYWGGLDGSLMFWVSMLSLFNAVAIKLNHKRHRDMIGYVMATVAAVQLFFLCVLIFQKNPFSTLLAGVPMDGKGLNPLLQNYWMVIHPPSLYLGFVGMTIPFAFCIGALAAGRLDDGWLHSIRVWVLIAWFFLTLGLTLGMIWAYEELGWGGYWAWDPVENAALIPWFTATAFLHSVMIQERKGMLKVWNVVLMITTFFFTIFGTFMTRSGVVQSVHAFGEDAKLAIMFILFMVVLLVVSFGLVLYRLPKLRSTGHFDSFLSREFAFLFNNWVLLLSAFFVLFATMFPTLSEAFVGERINLDVPLFNRIMVPIGLGLLLLMAVGPLLAWRVSSSDKLAKQLAAPLSVGVVFAAVITVLAILVWPRLAERSPFIIPQLRLPNSLICLSLIAFVLTTIVQEFARATAVRNRQSGGGPLGAFLGILIGKRRKFGGYVVHLGFAVMFLGFAGKSYSREKDVTLQRFGEVTEVGGYVFRYDNFHIDDNPNRTEFLATITVLEAPAGLRDGDGVMRMGEGGKPEVDEDKVAQRVEKLIQDKAPMGQVATLYPGRNQYKKGNGEQTTEVAISRGLTKDIYVVLNSFEGQNKINLKLVLNPLVNWVWLGFIIMGGGILICLLKDSWAEAFKPKARGASGA